MLVSHCFRASIFCWGWFLSDSAAESSVCLLIQPEQGPVPFSVSLWSFLQTGSVKRIMTAPRGSWHDFARRIEEVGLLDSHGLGCVDAHIGRGEPVLRSIGCSLDDLRKIGLRELSKPQATRVPAPLLQFYSRNNSRISRPLLAAGI
jgi:hypothetical protein